MDGSGLLFAEFIASLAPGVDAIVVSYPADAVLGYAELETLARAALPTDRPFVLVAESFSGPVAISLAASSPVGLRGVVLVCSFARSPIAAPRLLRSLLSMFPVWLVPIQMAAAVLLGRFGSSALRGRLSSAMASVRPSVWRARIRAVLSADVTTRLSKVTTPILYLRATGDRVVPRSASELISGSLPSVRVVDIESPHFMLQAKPAESAAQVQVFVRELGFVL
jgi:pimeloyl-ACP methyl ester carboxylesterase